MKSYRTTVFFTALFALLAWGGLIQAQYDDLYYDPDTDGGYYDYSNSNATSGDDLAYSGDNTSYDSESYNYDDDDDYDFQYTSRIRRFHRPYYGFDYYDPVYVDMYYYDPFFTPGTTVLIYDNFYRWNRMNRWNRYSYWNRWDPWYSPGFGWNAWNPWNPWGPRNSAFISYNSFNNFYGGGFYGGGLYGGGFYGGAYSNYYCPPSWGSGYTYNTVSVANNTYYGPRSGGSTRTSANSRRDYNPTLRETPKDVTTTSPVVSRNDREQEIRNTGGADTRKGTEEARVIRARTYERGTAPQVTSPASRTDRNQNQAIDRNPNTSRSGTATQPTPRTYDRNTGTDRNTNTRQPVPRTYDRNTNTRQPAPRTYDRNSNTRQSTPSPRTFDSGSNNNRSSRTYSPSSGSDNRSSGNSPRSSGSSIDRSSGSSGSSGSLNRSGSGSSTRSSGNSSSGSSRSGSSSSRRGGN